ncbi:hypothetical protein [Bacteroides sp.]|uniref:hypothetical protein n=1 Tax=Bacteroides sp. TaxID=29523 RepID=UPI003AAB5D64
MGLLGTIFSVIPTVAGVIGNLLGANNKDYIKIKMYQPSVTNDEPNIYFVKTDDDRIKLYNSCGYPIHVSMENVGVESDKGYILEDCGGGLDVTDLISSHSAKYKNTLRVTANVAEAKTDGAQSVSLTYSGKLDRNIEGAISIGEHVSVEAIDNDFMLIIHSGCTLKEISSLSIKGEGNEPARIYNNVSPDAIIPPLQSSIASTDEDDAYTIVFPNAVAPFEFSQVLEIEVCLICEVEELTRMKRLSHEDRKRFMAGEEWDFLREGRCVKEC